MVLTRAGGALVARLARTVDRIADRVRPHVREDDLGKAGIALTLALLTVLAAIVAGLQSHASMEAQRTQREADRIGLAATGQDGTAVVRVGTSYGIYRRWFEQLERVNWATDSLTRNPDGPNQSLLETLEGIDQEIADWAAGQTPLLQPPYYDPEIRISNFSAFEADRMLGPATRDAERRAIEADVADGWDRKAEDYITVLTVLAVGLFFLGLGSTVSRRARAILAVAGTTFGLVALAWTVAITVAGIHRVPALAVERVVESDAQLFRAGGESPPGTTVTAAARTRFDTAIAKASEAIALDPSYLSGYHRRANARLAYADTIAFSPEGQDATTSDLLRGAIDDYRAYIGHRPDDYAAWWNLGWAAYLLGDAPSSLAATNRAIELAPTQFTLYLNRTLALLATRDRDAALRDVEQAIQLAARDSTDSASWYLGQSDFNIGRLAALHPDHAETLRAIQRQLREAQVALRVLGTPVPARDAPQLGAVTVTPIELGRYAGGEYRELEPLDAGAGLEAPEAVGFRVTVNGTSAIGGRTLSARVWVNGQSRADYRVDVPVASDAAGDATVVELVNPYGRAGFDLDAGAYQLQLFVDGATRYDVAWTVEPRPSEPQFATTATPLIDEFVETGFACDPPATTDGTTMTICSGFERDVQFVVNVSSDPRDRITAVVLGATSESTSADLEGNADLFFTYVLRLLYPPDLAERAEAWLDQQGTAVNDVELGGTTIRVFGATETSRNLDIWSPWPAD